MNEAISERLLSEFPANDYEEWKAAAEALLKGVPFDKAMRTRTLEGIVLEPIYRKEDLDALQVGAAFPGQGDYLRGSRPEGPVVSGWEIAQEIGVGCPAAFNAELLNALENGQSAVRIPLDAATRRGLDPDQAMPEEVARDGLSLADVQDLRKALQGVMVEAAPVYFESGGSGLWLSALLRAWAAEGQLPADAVRGGLGIDPLASLAIEGSLRGTMEAAMDEAALAATSNVANLPRVAAMTASGWCYHAAGASSTQELACALAGGVFYLRELAKRGLAVDQAAGQLHLELAIGPDFFMEVAKIRAARRLWSRAATALGVSRESAKIFIHARTGVFNKTLHDPYVNMLRGTSEAFAAVIGGADSISVSRFDEVARSANTFASRIARNVQLILQEECELTAVIDPAGGSWYVERLTDDFARAAWSQFQLIEKEGGAFEALRSGYIQESIARTRTAKADLLGQRRIKLIGTNQYPNLQETTLSASEGSIGTAHFERAAEIANRRSKEVPQSARKPIDSLQLDALVEQVRGGLTVGQFSLATRQAGNKDECNKLPNTRLAEIYEELRNASARYKQAHGRGPLLFLANMGPLRRHKLRADFTRAFFETGGFETIYSPGFEEGASAAAAFKDSGAQMAAICGTDQDYAERLVDFAQALKQAKPDATVILAGHPGDHEAAYREAGMDDYIFVKSDNYKINRKYLQHLGAL